MVDLISHHGLFRISCHFVNSEYFVLVVEVTEQTIESFFLYSLKSIYCLNEFIFHLYIKYNHWVDIVPGFVSPLCTYMMFSADTCCSQ